MDVFVHSNSSYANSPIKAVHTVAGNCCSLYGAYEYLIGSCMFYKLVFLSVCLPVEHNIQSVKLRMNAVNFN